MPLNAFEEVCLGWITNKADKVPEFGEMFATDKSTFYGKVQ